MTTFGPPPVPPEIRPTAAPWEGPRSGPAPWSAAGIGAFVLALLGWIGITAVLGLIFAGVAFYTTRGGRRRGLGLAIAAIPISLITGAFAVVVFVAILILGRMAEVPGQLEPVFNAGEPAAQASALRDLASTDFNASVGDDTLRAWFAHVNGKHGRLTGVSFNAAEGFFVTPEGTVRLSIPSKFVNGEATLRVTFDTAEVWDARIHDIDMDGASPRRPDPSAAP